MRELFSKLGLDPEVQTPGRQVVQHIGESLVQAMQMALASGGEPEAAELVACECVVLAETKDHLNWELLSKYAEKAKGDEKKAMTAACEEVEEQEDEHIYHSKGWCRELWIQSLGMPAVLPPPEEEKEGEDCHRCSARRKSARGNVVGRFGIQRIAGMTTASTAMMAAAIAIHRLM